MLFVNESSGIDHFKFLKLGRVIFQRDTGGMGVGWKYGWFLNGKAFASTKVLI